MKDKLMTVTQAADMIGDGIHLGVGAGMTMNPMPVIRGPVLDEMRQVYPLFTRSVWGA